LIDRQRDGRKPIATQQTAADGTATNTGPGLTRVRSIAAGSAGNLVEYYDWYAYSAFALYFAPVFFPDDDPTAQLLNTAAIFAVGFIMRPVGGWLLGLYADRRGRREALLLSVVAMGVGSLLIALTPGYAAIGIAAPILLVLARLLQGLSLGGEYASSATYLSEMATPSTRGFYSSFIFATLSAGQLVALGVLVLLQLLMSPAALEDWGWRIPFFIGSALAFGAILLRRGMAETSAFEHGHHSPRRSSVRALLFHWRACLIVAGLTLGGTVAFYAFTTYMQKYLVNTAGFSRETATGVMAAALFVFILMQPVLGALSDRVGRRPLLIAFGILGSIATVPLLTALAEVESPTVAWLLITGALAIVSLYSSVSAIAKAELFPVEIRALGVGLPYALTVSLFGGTAEYVALALKSAGHESVFYWYVAGCIACSLICFLIIKDPKSQSFIDREAAADG
jgi:MHS family alpha-ketoglutarate permease-like MFS transporter